MHSVPLLAYYMHLDEHIETLQDAIHFFESKQSFWWRNEKTNASTDMMFCNETIC